MISVNWPTGVITIPTADLTALGGDRYELDVDALRLALKDLEDSEEGIAWPATHRHNTQVTLSGVTYARSFEIINGYTVTFEDGTYTVSCIGANHNLADVKTVNSVSLIVGNAAGLIAVDAGGGGSSPATIASAVWSKVLEAGFDAAEMLRLIAAHAAGDLAGAPAGPIQITGLDGTTVRIAGLVDVYGNRIVSSRNGD